MRIYIQNRLLFNETSCNYVAVSFEHHEVTQDFLIYNSSPCKWNYLKWYASKCGKISFDFKSFANSSKNLWILKYKKYWNKLLQRPLMDSWIKKIKLLIKHGTSKKKPKSTFFKSKIRFIVQNSVAKTFAIED